jgi:hypothetical protein
MAIGETLMAWCSSSRGGKIETWLSDGHYYKNIF